MASDLILAFVIGIAPAFFWLLFWLKEDKKNPEPKGLLFTTFFMGGVVVFFALQIERFIDSVFIDDILLLTLWAGTEEFLKILAVLLVSFRSRFIDEPIDYPIYFITAALGFASVENILFLIDPVINDGIIAGLITGDLRFLGATLLHSVASGLAGVIMGLFIAKYSKTAFWPSLLIGLITATFLHTMFNFFIIKEGTFSFIQTFAGLWVVTIIILLLFEKLKRMKINYV